MRFFLLWLVGVSSAGTAAAHDAAMLYGVPDWTLLVPEYRTEFQTYRSATMADPKLSADEKTRRITGKYRDIADRTERSRTAAYEAVVDIVGIGNSATNKGEKPKKVKRKCRSSLLPQMYVTAQTVRGSYRSGLGEPGPYMFEGGKMLPAKEIMAANGSQICAIALKQSGQGRKFSYTQGEFRIRPEEIRRLVTYEVAVVMGEVSK